MDSVSHNNIDDTSPSLIKDLKKIYKNRVITPQKSAEELFESLKNEFKIYKIVSTDILNLMTLETIKWAMKKLSSEAEIYSLVRNENSEKFYKYLQDRFVLHPALCILYDKSSGKICSNNCELLDTYITILRGIDKKDIEDNSAEYKSYLYSMYFYDTYKK
ncbi:MAG: hypothetical protein ACI4CS_03490 [Candidatus Weimeria sp.]